MLLRAGYILSESVFQKHVVFGMKAVPRKSAHCEHLASQLPLVPSIAITVLDPGCECIAVQATVPWLLNETTYLQIRDSPLEV